MTQEDRKISFEPATLDEHETTINFNYVTRQAQVYTTWISFAKKLIDLCLENKDTAQIKRIDKYGAEFSVPLDWVSIKPKRKRDLTEEMRQAMSDRLAAAREKKRSQKGETE